MKEVLTVSTDKKEIKGEKLSPADRKAIGNSRLTVNPVPKKKEEKK